MNALLRFPAADVIEDYLNNYRETNTDYIIENKVNSAIAITFGKKLIHQKDIQPKCLEVLKLRLRNLSDMGIAIMSQAIFRGLFTCVQQHGSVELCND